MHVGITLQSLDPTWGGIGIYTEEIVRHLLKLDRNNEYILIYPGFGAPRKCLGRYQRKYRNVTEVETDFLRIPSGWFWDQVVVPKIAKEYAIDVLFNPYLSVPVRGRFKKVMIIHSVEYHRVPQVYDWSGYLKWFCLHKLLLPRADRLISISNLMTQDLRDTVNYPARNIRTIYHGLSKKFQVVRDPQRLQEAKEEYGLPEQFILFVGQIYPQKNFPNLLKALHLMGSKIPHDLVVAGRPRWKHAEDLEMVSQLGLTKRVHFLHWVPNDDLPALYSLASCFVYPSLYEAFGLAQLEAMACGCPVVAARAGAIPEIAGGAALLFDPQSPEEMGEAMSKVIYDSGFRQQLVEKGLVRVKEFSWERCAAQTLQVLEEVVRT